MSGTLFAPNDPVISVDPADWAQDMIEKWLIKEPVPWRLRPLVRRAMEYAVELDRTRARQSWVNAQRQMLAGTQRQHDAQA